MLHEDKLVQKLVTQVAFKSGSMSFGAYNSTVDPLEFGGTDRAQLCSHIPPTSLIAP